MSNLNEDGLPIGVQLTLQQIMTANRLALKAKAKPKEKPKRRRATKKEMAERLKVIAEQHAGPTNAA